MQGEFIQSFNSSSELISVCGCEDSLYRIIFALSSSSFLQLWVCQHCSNLASRASFGSAKQLRSQALCQISEQHWYLRPTNWPSEVVINTSCGQRRGYAVAISKASLFSSRSVASYHSSAVNIFQVGRDFSDLQNAGTDAHSSTDCGHHVQSEHSWTTGLEHRDA